MSGMAAGPPGGWLPRDARGGSQAGRAGAISHSTPTARRRSSACSTATSSSSTAAAAAQQGSRRAILHCTALTHAELGVGVKELLAGAKGAAGGCAVLAAVHGVSRAHALRRGGGARRAASHVGGRQRRVAVPAARQRRAAPAQCELTSSSSSSSSSPARACRASKQPASPAQPSPAGAHRCRPWSGRRWAPPGPRPGCCTASQRCWRACRARSRPRSPSSAGERQVTGAHLSEATCAGSARQRRRSTHRANGCGGGSIMRAAAQGCGSPRPSGRARRC